MEDVVVAGIDPTSSLPEENLYVCFQIEDEPMMTQMQYSLGRIRIINALFFGGICMN